MTHYCHTGLHLLPFLSLTAFDISEALSDTAAAIAYIIHLMAK